jgi:hypothetical protein
MENMGISWSFLTFGFYDLDNNKAYGDSAFLTPALGLHIFFPED